MTAVALLAAETGFSKQRIKKIMQQGAVWLSAGKGQRSAQRLRRHSKLLSVGDQLHLYYDEKVLNTELPPPQLVADEGAYSVWYKPYGMWSQGSKWGDHTAVYRWVEVNAQPQRSAFLVHRLDRAATGLIMVAHQKKAAAALSQMFASRALSKRYQVIVHGQLDLALGERQTIQADLDGKSSCTHVSVIEYCERRDMSLLSVEIETGRKHQIRRHLAGIGYPVVGDRLHGVATDDTEWDLQLTACYLQFVCPLTGEPREYQLPGSLLPTL